MTPEERAQRVIAMSNAGDGPLKSLIAETIRGAELEAEARMKERCAALEKALSATAGYLLNAKIDLETGAPKRTAIMTIDGGLAMVRAALHSTKAE